MSLLSAWSILLDSTFNRFLLFPVFVSGQFWSVSRFDPCFGMKKTEFGSTRNYSMLIREVRKYRIRGMTWNIFLCVNLFYLLMAVPALPSKSEESLLVFQGSTRNAWPWPTWWPVTSISSSLPTTSSSSGTSSRNSGSRGQGPTVSLRSVVVLVLGFRSMLDRIRLRQFRIDQIRHWIRPKNQLWAH
jgi:hypothetical protein